MGHVCYDQDNAWLLDKVTVENTTTRVQWLMKAGVEGLWFDAKKGDGKVTRELIVHERLDKSTPRPAAEDLEVVRP